MKSIEALFGKYDFNLDDRKVSDEVQRIIAEEFDSNNNVSVWRHCFSLIDLTSLNSTDTEEKIEDIMKRVNDFPHHIADIDNVAAVCVYPALVPIARQTLTGDTKIAAVSACFPSSQTFIEAKVAEVALTAAAGADEIDVVISVGKYLSGRYQEVFDEIEEIKASARNAHLKVILESGSLPSMNDIKRAYVMCHTIREYYQATGIKIGFKPAGGIATTEEAVKFYTIVNHILGEEWINKDFFRFGASRLANNLLSDIYGKQIKYY